MIVDANHSKNRIPEIIDRLVDDQVGIIRHVYELPRDASEPPFFHFAAQACNTRAFIGQRNFGRTGGASIQRELALSKAVGEAIERYCSAIYDPTEFPLMPYSSADFQCVPPEEFALYHKDQYAASDFPYMPFEASRAVRWTRARDLISNQTWHVPASMVYLPYYYNKQNGEEPISQPISTGLACHGSFAQAAISAVCEVLERDAFTIMWQARISMPKIRIDSLGSLNREIVTRLERVGTKIILVDMTLDSGIPTVLAVLRARSPEAPALVFAASADLDAERAVTKSLEEAAHTRQLAQDLKCNREPIIPCLHYDNILHQDDHVLLYCDHRNTSLAEFVWASSKSKEFKTIQSLATGDHQKDLAHLVKRIHSIGYRTLVSDVTSPDVKQLGLTVVRAIIPGFHPLFMGHRLRALGGSRLQTIPYKMGYVRSGPQLIDNPAPHPYP